MPKFTKRELSRSTDAQRAQRYFDTVEALRAEKTPESRKQLKKLAEVSYHSAKPGPGQLWSSKSKRGTSRAVTTIKPE